jgi:hypothetical protein
VATGKLGVYPKIDGQGKIVVYLLHKDLDSLKLVASLIQVPKYYIHVDHKYDYGYNYIKLLDSYVDKWNDFINKSNKWRTI